MLTRLSVCRLSIACNTRFQGRQQLFLPVASFTAYPTRHQSERRNPVGFHVHTFPGWTTVTVCWWLARRHVPLNHCNVSLM